MTILASKDYMNDHNLIYKRNNLNFLPEDALAIHKKHRKDIFEHAAELGDHVRKKVLVTHHGFSSLSIADAYKNEKHLNGAFVSEMSNEIIDAEFDYAHHGHTHNSFDYMIGNTHVITNPRGYAKQIVKGKSKNENSNFDVNLVIEV
jgi:hypothetical protein